MGLAIRGPKRSDLRVTSTIAFEELLNQCIGPNEHGALV